MSAQNPYAPQKQVNQADPLNPKAPTPSVGNSLLQSQGGTLPPQQQAPSQPVVTPASPASTTVSSQGTIDQQNQIFKQAKDSGQITSAQYDQAINVQNQNANFLAAKNSGQITQDQYNQAIVFQQSKPQTASSLGVSDDIFQQAKKTVPEGAYITGITPTAVNYFSRDQIQQERASTNELLDINNQFAKEQTDYTNFGVALQSNKINQLQYNQAIGYENQLESATVQRAQKGGFIDPLTAQASIAKIDNNYDSYIDSQRYGSVKNINPTNPLQYQAIEKPNTPNFVAPTIQNIFTNPLGVASSALDLFSIGVNKAKGPVGAVLNLETGGAINMLNQQTQIRNAMGGIAGVKAEPLIPLRNSTQKTGATVNTIGEAVEISAVAPVIGSAIGIGAGGVVAGEALGVGIDQGFKFYNQGLNTKGLLTPTEFATSAAEGGVLSLVGGGIFKGIGVAGKVLDIGLPSGKIGAVTSILGRAGVNAGISGTTGFVASGGDPNAAEQGLAFGALFSAGMEPIGYLGARVPTIKYGGASVPFTDTVDGEVYSGEASFKGLYYGRGADAKPLLGTWDNLPGEGARVQPTLGETPGYQPKSPLQAEVTRRVMLETGTPKETIDINRKAVDVVMIGKGVRNPQLFQDYLPKETGTSTLGEVSELKSYIIQNKDVVVKVFGKASAIPQENPDFGYEVMDANGQVKSSVRSTADFDIQLKSGITQDQVQEFAKGAFDIYAKNPEANATMKPGKSLISTTPVELRGTGSDVTAHAVDIHSDFDKIMNPQQPGGGQVGDKTWGIPITEKPRMIESIPTANIKEQLAAKFSSIFNINEEGEFAPVPHRGKDIPDTLMDAKTLIEQRSNPKIKARGNAELQDIADYFGAGKIGDLKPTTPQTEEYIVSRPSSSTSRVNNPFASMPSSPASRGNNNLLDIPQSYPSQGNRNSKTQPSLIPSVSSRSNNDYLGLPSYLDTGYPTTKQPSYPTFPSEKPQPQIYKPTPYIPTYPIYPTPHPPNPYPSPPPPSPSTKSGTDKNNPFFPGNKFESGGSSLNPFKISGLDTRKRVYPIFSGEEVLRI